MLESLHLHTYVQIGEVVSSISNLVLYGEGREGGGTDWGLGDECWAVWVWIGIGWSRGRYRVG